MTRYSWDSSCIPFSFGASHFVKQCLWTCSYGCRMYLANGIVVFNFLALWTMYLTKIYFYNALQLIYILTLLSSLWPLLNKHDSGSHTCLWLWSLSLSLSLATPKDPCNKNNGLKSMHINVQYWIMLTLNMIGCLCSLFKKWLAFPVFGS